MLKDFAETVCSSSIIKEHISFILSEICTKILNENQIFSKGAVVIVIAKSEVLLFEPTLLFTTVGLIEHYDSYTAKEQHNFIKGRSFKFIHFIYFFPEFCNLQ